MDPEIGSYKHLVKKETWKTVLTLAFQSLGVVYGDLSTSPLYVYKSTFAEDIQHSETNEEIFGVLSFVFWTLTLIPLFKYVFIVLKADDNGEGGTFALYSLLCRYARVSCLPNGQLADEELTEYRKDDDGWVPSSNFAIRLKSTLEQHKVLQRILLVLALIGTCMVIGDGVLTPSISVFSAVSGLELSMGKEHHKYVELPVACVILIALFALQHYGTHKVGFMFAPVVLAWLLCISSIGLYNIIYWNPLVYRALSPHYMLIFLRKTQRSGLMSLGGILLCITGSEAMFADLGHFSQLSIKIAFTCLVYPSLIIAYMGQAAYLSRHHVIENNYRIGFYVSVPECLRWPVLILAVMAAVVGSQAIITGTFSIIKQCTALGCFPNVKIIHTSSKIHGQIYIPEINWILMVLCLAVTIGFRDTKRMGNASGLAVITVMLVTTCLMSLVIVLCWHKNVFYAILFVVFFGTIEAIYFSAALTKFFQGAWVPVAFSFTFLIIMIGPRECRIYRCIVRYGYHDFHKDDIEFERDLVYSIAEFIRSNREADDKMTVVGTRTESIQSEADIDPPGTSGSGDIRPTKKRVRFIVPERPRTERRVMEELEQLNEAREAGIAYILGNTYVRAKPGSSMVKKIVIDCGYELLRRNTRPAVHALSVPHASTLEVGMIHYV
ncbi:hypothetical protein ACFE04_023646 [Oxalis oulophora]